MKQIEFAQHVKEILSKDSNVIGVAVAGSWLSNELDEFSDLDLIIVTKEPVGGNKTLMMAYAGRFNGFLSGFTGEHVGEPRLLICLYDDPLLHVDLKFLQLTEFASRIETPVILLDTDDQLKNVCIASKARFPYPDYQWIEDRFWTWIHYALLKIGRGEYMEAFDFFSFLRMTVLGPLLHIKNGKKPKGVRRVETQLTKEDLETLKLTIPSYEKASLLDSLQQAVDLYQSLRQTLFKNDITLHLHTEESVMRYFNEIKKG